MIMKNIIKMKVCFKNLSLRLKISSGSLFMYSENNELFLYYGNIEFDNLDGIFELFDIIVNVLKDYPNTILLVFTLFPIFKIYKRLNMLYTNKFKNVGYNENKVSIYTSKYLFSLCFWFFIAIFIFFIYPSETDLLKYYLPKYHSLTTDDYKIIKISFSIFANVLALITSWYFFNLKKWINVFPVFALIWSCILGIDILYYPDLIASGTLYISNSLGLLGIITGLSNIEHSGPKWQSNVVDNKNFGDNKSPGENKKPEGNSVEDRGRIKRRRKLLWLKELRHSTHLEKDPLISIPEVYDLTDFSNNIIWDREYREGEFWRPRRSMLKPLYRYIPEGSRSKESSLSDIEDRISIDKPKNIKLSKK